MTFLTTCYISPTWSETLVHFYISDLHKEETCMMSWYFLALACPWFCIFCIITNYHIVGVSEVDGVTNSFPLLMFSVLLHFETLESLQLFHISLVCRTWSESKWRSEFWCMSFWTQSGQFYFSQTESRWPPALLGLNSVAYDLLFPNTHRNVRHVLHAWRYGKVWLSVCLYSE